VTSGSYESALAAIAAERRDIIVMTAENRAPIRHLPALLGERFVDVGICEQTLVGAAAGLALRGRTPVAHALAAFLVMRAYEFIRTDVGIGRLPVKLVGYVPGFLSEGNGPTHQAIEDVALMRGIPGMQVFCPADEAELVAGLPAILASPQPCYVRYNALPPVCEHPAPFSIGRAECVAEGDGVAILTYGLMLREALRARAILEARHVPVQVLNLRMLKPLDEPAVLAAARGTELLVTLEDHLLTGGLHSIVAELLVRSGVRARLLALGLEERWFRPAPLPAVLRHEGLSGARVAERILEALIRPLPFHSGSSPCPIE
jgi:transketolase